MCTLRAANRRLIEAIETPPDTGEEERLDRLAADLWEHANGERPSPDPGHLCRLRHTLRRIADRSPEPRARHLMRAREKLGDYAEGSDETPA
ncbi:MAG: hypothetical protein ABEH66_01195 [Halobacteriales archaeon]